MEFPLILNQRVFLDERLRVFGSSHREESIILLPMSHSEVGFRSGHLEKRSASSIWKKFSKRGEVFSIKTSSSKREAVLQMVEAHS